MAGKIKNTLWASDTFILLVMISVALAVRFALLQVRWINPDEGAHLMDARYLIEGLMPVVDFGSRQPFYVFAIAIFLKVFGITLTAGRLLPLFSSIAAGVMIYFIGRQIYGKNIGLIAAALYLFLPLPLIWSTIVKTEPLTIFLASLSIYFLLLYVQPEVKKRTWLLLSGTTAAFAFYVRQPSLYLPMAILTYLIFFEKETFREKLFLVGHFLLGYLAVVAGFVAVYLDKMSLQKILFSQLNPLNLIWNRLMHTLGLLPEAHRIVDENTFRILDQTRQYTWAAWNDAVFLSLFVLVAAGFYFMDKGTQRFRTTNIVLLLWSGYAILLYLFQSANRGFYSQYFTEALPPLLLFAAFSFHSMYRRLGLTIKHILLILAVFLGLAVVFKAGWRFYPGEARLIVIATFLTATIVTIRFKMAKKNVRISAILFLVFAQIVTLVAARLIGLHMIFATAAVGVVSNYLLMRFPIVHLEDSNLQSQSIILLTAILISAAFSGRHLGPSYEAVWTQQSLANIRTFLEKESQATDTVLSGGMIWTFESELVPFMGISHPTEFLKKRQETFENQFSENPPTFIILDKYTQKKFNRYWEFIIGQLETNYELVHAVPNANFTIKVYRRVPKPTELKPAYATKSSSPA